MPTRNIIQKRTGCKSQGSFLFTTTFFAIFSPNIYSLVVSILVSFQLLTYSVLEKAAASAFLAARCQRQEAISHNNREHINGLSTLDNLENLEKKNYIPFRKSHINCLHNYNHFALLHIGVKSAMDGHTYFSSSTFSRDFSRNIRTRIALKCN